MLTTLKRCQARRSAGGTESGFTLIELLIVIVVLGILAGVTVFALGGVTSQSAVAACNADAKTVDIAVAAYNAQTGGTPVATAALLAPPVSPSTTIAGQTFYMQSWPSSTHYAITLVGGVVNVASLTPVVAAAPYDNAAVNPCAAVK